MVKLIYSALITVIFLLPAINASECQDDFNIYLQLKALDEDNLPHLSDYQYPDYKEDDLLILWRFIVVNEGTCDSTDAYFKLNMTNKDESIEHLFCGYQLYIPTLKPNETYYLNYNGVYEDEVGGKTFLKQNYTDSVGKQYSLCRVALLTTGLWKVKSSLEPRYNNVSIGSWSFSLINEKNQLDDGRFKVRDKSEVLALEIQRMTILLSIIGVITTLAVGLAGILIQIWLANREDIRRQEREKTIQQQILGSLGTLLLELEMASDGHLRELNRKKPVVPSYFIPEIDSFYYLSKLNSKIEVQGDSRDTTDLKKILSKLEGKIKTINRLVELAQDSIVIGNKVSSNKIIKELKTNTYYKDLGGLLDSLRREIKSFS